MQSRCEPNARGRATRPTRLGVLSRGFLTLALIFGGALPALAQRGAAPPPPQPQPSPATPATLALLVGSWSGTATIPLKDSSIVVPVTYTFTREGSAISGSAFVPGQGTGPIAALKHDSSSVRFTVIAPQGALEHQGTVLRDGAIEGMINLDKLPVAKFRITRGQR
jgi:hypothetical protein